MIESLMSAVPEERKHTGYDAQGRMQAQMVLQPEVIEVMAQHGQFAVLGWHNADTHYVLDGAVTPRPANPATLDAAAISLHSLPAPCVIVIDGTRYDCADATAALDLPFAKTYAVTVEAFPYLDASFEVTKP